MKRWEFTRASTAVWMASIRRGKSGMKRFGHTFQNLLSKTAHIHFSAPNAAIKDLQPGLYLVSDPFFLRNLAANEQQS